MVRPKLKNEQLYKKIKCKIILVQYGVPLLRLKHALVLSVWDPDPVGPFFFNRSDLEKFGSGSVNHKKENIKESANYDA